MNEREYRDKLKELSLEHSAKIKELTREFALSNNTVEIGDVIEDSRGAIKVTSIEVGRTLNSLPCCVYKGTVLTKKGVPSKRGTVRAVYQDNVLPKERVNFCLTKTLELMYKEVFEAQGRCL